MAKAELMISVCVNGRPLWRKSKIMRGELTYKMTDKEYDRVLSAAIFELDAQVTKAQKTEK